ncbi:peptidoglycan/LPS O-acetylase OafA/YrhL [Arthrobacter sp. PvP102]|nr:peptidoglycan/LPS O-acetylase OafA/YrhL [Arthrobacter sp. PvP103]MBP1237632.1 peptidoglycan/LPS O-acetylase OafA/YrhL [Arthrobacter sp. PvP102]
MFVFAFHLNSAGVISFAPAKLGYAGVAFFFVLSGFLLAWTDRPGQATSQFYLRRFARVYPSHLAMMLVALCIPTGQGERGVLPTLMHLLLVQAWAPDFAYTYSLNGVAWSLSCEVFFYLLFPFIVISLRGRSNKTLAVVGFGLFFIISGAVLATTMIEVNSTVEAVRYTNPLVRLPEFVLGVCAALAMRAGWKPKLWMGFVLLAIAAVGFSVIPGKPAADVWGALFFLAVIVHFAHSDCTRPLKIMQVRPLTYAGEVSFAFYLVHQIVIIHSVQLVGTRSAAGLIAFFVSVSCAVVLHHGVEQLANRAILSRFSNRRG